jgi:hypothetical protein
MCGPIRRAHHLGTTELEVAYSGVLGRGWASRNLTAGVSNSRDRGRYLPQLELGIEHCNRKRLTARPLAFDPLFTSTELRGPTGIATRQGLLTLAPHALQL